jgi:DNA adenine methylase
VTKTLLQVRAKLPQKKGNRITIRQDISPLRYPGGKRKLLPLVEDLINKSGLDVDLLVEPFAGGAAVSIGLLEAGVVRRIALADKDLLVASFWRTVFSREASNLAGLVMNTPVTLTEWRRQRGDFPRSPLRRAFKCLFLNRTNFSGFSTGRFPEAV